MKAKKKTPYKKAVVPGTSYFRSRLTTGSELLPSVDHRSSSMRRYRDLRQELTADLGGPEGLSQGQRLLIDRAATLAVFLELREARWMQDSEPPSYGSLTRHQRVVNTLRRTVESLGLNRGRHAIDITPNLIQRIEQLTS